MRFFFFGTLRDRDIMEAVIDRPPPAIIGLPAVLGGFRCVRLSEEPFPALVRDPSSQVEGVVVDWFTERDLDRVQFFESVEYAPTDITVTRDGERPISARMFAVTGVVGHFDIPWDFEDWLVNRKHQDLALTRVWMEFYGVCDVVEANRLWDAAVAAGRPFEDIIRSLKSRASGD